MTIYDRIDACYADIAQIKFEKDKWVGKWVDQKDQNGKIVGKTPDLSDRNGYYVISIQNILAAVQKVQAKHGVKVFFEGPFYDPGNCEKRITLTQKDRYGNDVQTVYANGHYDVEIVGEGPEDAIQKRIQCEAKDPAMNDKLGNKLLTNAMRSLYRSLYTIDADDSKDPEEIAVGVEPEAAPARAQAASGDSFLSGGITRQEKKKAVLEWIPENQKNPDYLEFCNIFGSDPSQWQLGTFVHFYDDIVAKSKGGEQ